jgi:hypothetical protein
VLSVRLVLRKKRDCLSERSVLLRVRTSEMPSGMLICSCLPLPFLRKEEGRDAVGGLVSVTSYLLRLQLTI